MENMNRLPHIVFVFCDQLRAQALGYAGDTNVKTPFLDSLASCSINFTNAVSNCPICTPYRGSLLSGQYPLRTGLFVNDVCLPDNGHSLGQELKRGGYHTAWIGKWHIDGHGRTSFIPAERRQGFDYWKTLECTHNYNNSLYYEQDETTPRQWEGYDAFAQTADACEFIKNTRDKTKPFALFLSLGTPHDPYETAPAELQALYPPEDIVLRKNVAPHRAQEARKQLQGYYAHITAIDQSVSRLFQTLETEKLLEDTLFVFTSDHGDMLESQALAPEGEHSPRKQVPYSESVSVPFLLHYPRKFPKAQRIDTPMATPDIMPMLLDLCGLPIPSTVQGENILLTPERQSVLLADYVPFADWRIAKGGRPYRGIRTRQYTFIRDLNGPWLLFDRLADPFELHNLVQQSDCASLRNDLDKMLDQWLEATDDPFDTPELLLQKYNYSTNDHGEIPYF